MCKFVWQISNMSKLMSLSKLNLAVSKLTISNLSNLFDKFVKNRFDKFENNIESNLTNSNLPNDKIWQIWMCQMCTIFGIRQTKWSKEDVCKNLKHNFLIREGFDYRRPWGRFKKKNERSLEIIGKQHVPLFILVWTSWWFKFWWSNIRLSIT